jgi:CheY-like chemotaxis protein
VAYTILIVDDDDLNREVMEAYLSLEGYSALITGSGRKALEMAKLKQPDLMILLECCVLDFLESYDNLGV